MQAVEAANPGILDEPLPPTQPFQPGKRTAACEEAASGAGKNVKDAGSNKARKRKAAAMQEATQDVPPKAPELEVSGSCGVEGAAVASEPIAVA